MLDQFKYFWNGRLRFVAVKYMLYMKSIFRKILMLCKMEYQEIMNIVLLKQNRNTKIAIVYMSYT